VHASRGKLTRAEPVAALYEQGRVHHVGYFGPLEDQQTGYDGSRAGPSPDRLDALCWALTELMLGEPPGGYIKPALLLVPKHEAREPVEMPQHCRMLCASAAGCIADPEAVGTVYFAVPHAGRDEPLVIIDWDVLHLEAGALEHWFAAVLWDFDHLGEDCRPWEPPWLLIDSAGIGATLVQQVIPVAMEHGAEGRQLLGELGWVRDESFGTMSERIVKASGHVASGRVQIARPAFEKAQSFKAVTRNHLLAQVAAFGLTQDAPSVGELLVAFANGVLAKFDTHHGPLSLPLQ
jgi:hypothetical protein